MKTENQVQSNFLNNLAGLKFHMGKLANIVINSQKKTAYFLVFFS